ncbi:MAG: type IX secretion system membrane protein PorP/SprF [Elusimicrobia bacterium]|nr:type IX secretion system membrane protein PorP/SprF [Elusimicrobiota bacterium]
MKTAARNHSLGAIFFALCLLLGAARPARAAFQEMGVGARAPGMGDVFTALADDVYTIHYNPAGLALLGRPEVGTSYTRLLMGLSDSSELSTTFLGYAHPLDRGRKGTLATSWEQFSLDQGLYNERALSFSYGRKLFQDLGPGTLYGGLSLKHLQRSFGHQPEASNAFENGTEQRGHPDPVLSGKNSVSVFDADAGALYRLGEHYTLGLALIHFPQPNVAFSSADSDPVHMTTRLGLNYASLLSNLGVQFETLRSPAGTRDKNLAVAAERWFLRMFVGDFGLRGALNIGDRGYRQVALGVSYRTKRISLDYGFSLPINSISATAGSHRVGISLRFGSPSESDESILMILEAMRQLKKGVMPELRAFGAGLSPAQKALLDEHVAIAKSLQAQAKYQASMERLSLALAVSPSDADLLKSFGRLNWIAQQVKELANYKLDPVQISWHQGILAYLAGDAALAMEKVSYARSLAPEHRALNGFLAQLELATGVKRPEIPQAPPARHFVVEQLLAQAAMAVEDGRYDDAVSLSRQVLEDEPANAAAWENLGTSYFAIGDYRNSLSAWKKAYGLEKNPTRRKMISRYMESLDKLLARPKPRIEPEHPKEPAAPAPAPAPVQPAPKPAATPAPAPAQPAAKPAAALRRGPATPQDIQRLYNAGVDFYTAGQLEKARDAFQEVLRLDPAYVPASKALKRVTDEMPQR